METAINSNHSISPYKNYWPLFASTESFESDRNDFINGVLPDNILFHIFPFVARFNYPIKTIDFDASSVRPEVNIPSETFLIYHVDNELLRDDSYENSILEAMIESDADIIMPPNKEYKIFLKFTVEKNNGPYFVD